MDLRNRLREYLKIRRGRLPWEHGLKEKATGKALAVWELLTPEDRLIISCFNPFRRVRNNLIE